MFAPSINVDLTKLQQAADAQPTGKKVAARGRVAPRKPQAKPQSEPEKDK